MKNGWSLKRLQKLSELKNSHSRLGVTHLVDSALYGQREDTVVLLAH